MVAETMRKINFRVKFDLIDYGRKRSWLSLQEYLKMLFNSGEGGLLAINDERFIRLCIGNTHAQLNKKQRAWCGI